MVCVNEKWIWENVRMWSLLFCVLFVWYSFPSTPCLVFPIFHCFYFYSNFNLPLTLSLQNLFSFSLMVETSALCFLPIDFLLQRALLVYLRIHILSQILNSHSFVPLVHSVSLWKLLVFHIFQVLLYSDWKPDLVGVIWSSTLYQFCD